MVQGRSRTGRGDAAHLRSVQIGACGFTRPPRGSREGPGGRAQLPTLRTSRGVCGAGLRSKGPEGGLLPLPGQGCWPPTGPQLPRPAPTACRTGVRWLEGLEAASAGLPVWLTEGMDRGWGQGARGGWCSHGQAGWEPGRVVVGCTRWGWNEPSPGPLCGPIVGAAGLLSLWLWAWVCSQAALGWGFSQVTPREQVGAGSGDHMWTWGLVWPPCSVLGSPGCCCPFLLRAGAQPLWERVGREEAHLLVRGTEPSGFRACLGFKPSLAVTWGLAFARTRHAQRHCGAAWAPPEPGAPPPWCPMALGHPGSARGATDLCPPASWSIRGGMAVTRVSRQQRAFAGTAPRQAGLMGPSSARSAEDHTLGWLRRT